MNSAAGCTFTFAPNDLPVAAVAPSDPVFFEGFGTRRMAAFVHWADTYFISQTSRPLARRTNSLFADFGANFEQSRRTHAPRAEMFEAKVLAK
jgi:hypothetical protein